MKVEALSSVGCQSGRVTLTLSAKMEYYNVIKEKIRSGEYSTVRRFSRSEVYNVFFDIEDEKGALIKDAVICSKCKNVYKRSTQCTSNLLRHQCYKLYRKKRDENDMELEPREETTMEMLLNPKSVSESHLHILFLYAVCVLCVDVCVHAGMPALYVQ